MKTQNLGIALIAYVSNFRTGAVYWPITKINRTHERIDI